MRGSKPGERRGGRQKGAKNKVTPVIAEAVKSAVEQGITPLEYMLSVMRNESAPPDRRDDMAKSAAPYVHSKLASIEHTGKNGEPIRIDFSSVQAGVL